MRPGAEVAVPPERGERRSTPRRTWLAWLAVALMLVLVMIGFVQWKQYELLNSA